jgi:hypothetical protein
MAAAGKGSPMALASRNAILFIAVAILGISLPAAAASTAAQAAHTMRQAQAVTVFSGALRGASATSSTDVWAVGDQCPTCADPGTLTLHWNGTHWSMVPSPNPGPTRNVLNAVAAVSPSDAWAVGSFGNSGCQTAATLILHWNGTHWSKVASPNPGAACNELSSVSAVSATNAWAVGRSCTFAINTCHTLVLHWNGTAWSKMASPSPGAVVFDSLAGVSADSPADAWAVGGYCASSCARFKTLILHWNGTRWSTVKSPNPGVGFYLLNGASTRSPADAWAVGGSCATTCDIQKTVILHWKGTAWSKVASPSPGPAINGLSAVTALSPADAWAVGDYCIRSACGARNTLILHWNGTAWTRVPSPSPSPRGTGNALSGVGAVSANDAWAVGTYVDTTTGHNDTLMLHWNGTAWSRT